jgi:hypothetical protein
MSSTQHFRDMQRHRGYGCAPRLGNMEERMSTSLVRQAIVALAVALGLVLFAPLGASAVGVGKTCGGIRGIPCDAGLFCQMKTGTCNVADNQGKCVKVPRFCPKKSSSPCAVATAKPTRTTASEQPQKLKKITTVAAIEDQAQAGIEAERLRTSNGLRLGRCNQRTDARPRHQSPTAASSRTTRAQSCATFSYSAFKANLRRKHPPGDAFQGGLARHQLPNLCIKSLTHVLRCNF